MRGNVIDIKTRKAVFGDDLRENLEVGLGPLLKDGASSEDKERAAVTVEQIICASMVSAAVALATKLAHSIAGKLTTNRP